ncbi:MAG: permease [Haloarculaceae archaeon]
MGSSNDTSRLLSYYRDYIGDPDRTTDVYAGFGIFFVGLGLAAMGVVAFLYSATLPPDSSSMFAVREVAAVAAAVGLPALLSGVVVLLPVDKRMRYLAGAGSVVCLAAVALFVWAYPQNWNVAQPPDYSAQGVAVYSLGAAMIVAATGAALVGHRVQQAREGEQAATAGETAGTSADGAETVDDEQVRADIERELGETELSWGGVERNETRRLELDTSALDDIDQSELPDSGTETRTADSDVDDAVSQLRGLQGGEVETASGDGTDEQASALRELREQREQAEDDEPSSVVDRIRDLF